MEYNIYSQSGQVKAVISPTDNSTHENSIMGDNVLNMSFTLFEFVRLTVNDYVVFEGEKYKLLEPYRPTKKSTIEYEYNCKFYGTVGDCKKGIVLKLVDGENKPDFALVDSAAVHLQLVVDNINRIKGNLDWTVGEVVDNGNREIVYDSTFCFDALNKIAETFETEWWVEGTTINMSRCEFGTQIELGYNQGLIDLARDDNEKARFFTRLLPIGSKRNIDPKVYGHSRLQLPGGVQFVERNTEYGIVEQAEEQAFSHIYPKRIGYVGTVRAVPTKVDGKDRIVYYFNDTGLNFDPNDYNIEGLVKKVVFQSGELNGRDFEVKFYSNTNEFEIILQYPYEDQQLPGGGIIPKTGDEYILYNLRMPTEYYPLVEAEFATAVDGFLEKYSIDTSVYKAANDYIYFDENNLDLKVGRRIKLLSDEYFDGGYSNSRVIRIVRKIWNPSIMDIEFSNAVSKGRMESLEHDVDGISVAFKEQLNKEALQVLKSWDSSDPSEYNVLSALRNLKTIKKIALRKDAKDSTDFPIEFKSGLTTSEVQTPHYSPGAMGSGGQLCEDPITHESTLTVHNVIAKNGITAPMFTIRLMAATGGIDVTSAAYAKLTSVTDGGTYWKCFYKAQGQIWKPLDQARIQSEFGGFLWGLVTSVSEQPNNNGEYSFNISKTNVANGSNTTPKVDDTVILYGHKGIDPTNAYRKTLFIKSCGVDNPDEGYEPYEAKYVEIDDFSLPKSKCVKWDGLKYEICVDSFAIRGRDGIVRRQPNHRGAYVNGMICYNYERVSHAGSEWQCVVDNTKAAPSSSSQAWVCVVSKGDAGAAGNRMVQVFKWSKDKPAKSSGNEHSGWYRDSVRGSALTTSDGKVLTANGKALMVSYPDDYRLWGCQGEFSGQTNALIDDWVDVYQMSGDDGKDGRDGKDYEYIFACTIDEVKPDTPATVQQDDYIPSGWTDDAQGVTAALRFEWSCKRVKIAGVWGDFSRPALWARFSEDGAKGDKGDKGNKGDDGKDVDPVLADQKKFEAIEAFFGGAVDRETIESLMSGTSAPFEVKNGVVLMRDAFVKNLAAMNAFIENLTARQIDTRARNAKGNPTGRGVAISKGSSAVALYDENGRLRATLDDGGRYVEGLNMMSADGTENMLYSSSMIQYMRNNMAEIFTLTPHSGMGMGIANGDGTYRTDFAFSRSGIILPSDAYINMPCVALAGYGVTASGSVAYNFGCKSRDTYGVYKPAGTRGKYYIQHDIGHTSYTIAVNLKALNNTWFGIWKEVADERTATSCTIYIASLASELVDLDFDITFFGKN